MAGVDGQNIVADTQRSINAEPGNNVIVWAGFRFYAENSVENTIRMDLYQIAAIPMPADSYFTLVVEGQHHVEDGRFTLTIESSHNEISPSLRGLGFSESEFSNWVAASDATTITGSWTILDETLPLTYDSGRSLVLRRIM